MNESGVKQQIVDNIQTVDTILVTVGSNPSVDELSAALGLTMYLNDLGKHATAVVSGALPPAINFLEPEKTFESSVDSLRDFVIALDKEKADHLRYKVEGDVVKIFITPYKTVITSKDLEYSQGDYNVEMVIGLGVTDQDHLDKALAAHGKIFHDAVVATIGTEPSTLGTIDWVEESASGLSEIAASLTESLQSAEKPMTPQVASALLTGVVAVTERFSNDKTTSQTMSVSAILMSAGANQQLIASKLREGAKLPMQQDDGNSQAASIKQQGKQPDQPKRRDGGLSIAHKEGDEEVQEKPKRDGVGGKSRRDTKKLTDDVQNKSVGKSVKPADVLDAALAKSNQEATSSVKTPEDILSEQLASVAPAAATPSVPTLEDIEMAQADEQLPAIGNSKSSIGTQGTPSEPTLGGTLSATADQAAQDKRNADAERNKAILTHGDGQHVGNSQPTFNSPLNGAGQTREQPTIDPFADTVTAVASPVQPLDAPRVDTLADLDQQNRAPVSDESAAALDAVNAVMDASQSAATFDPLAAIEQVAPQVSPMPDIAAPMAPPPLPMPDFSQLPPLPPPPVFPPVDPTIAAPGLPPVVSPLGPLPPELPQAPLPPEQLGDVLPAAAPQATAAPSDPGQFRIPGQ